MNLYFQVSTNETYTIAQFDSMRRALVSLLTFEARPKFGLVISNFSVFTFSAAAIEDASSSSVIGASFSSTAVCAAFSAWGSVEVFSSTSGVSLLVSSVDIVCGLHVHKM
eukprot:CAMPEP_0113299182 /NCGR_PEP_ID=MMETSP0010_2-20120614/1317_1 /TAXON_ID=216773 ORGANISM="Corethron hystrix, Strain 308" /NCGR_SAMPLE_ID=MMETSP0010_2 /ASSEMBLY_ACC=CAM_ASM_000155 /LENGTH=109 /DNA_ID=CAMNT_0000152361 /DNA_START=426 /DNA_END=755 /DNA_ORIENTATION=- /assembly_acc=CAM_ASM_000155